MPFEMPEGFSLPLVADEDPKLPASVIAATVGTTSADVAAGDAPAAAQAAAEAAAADLATAAELAAIAAAEADATAKAAAAQAAAEATAAGDATTKANAAQAAAVADVEANSVGVGEFLRGGGPGDPKLPAAAVEASAPADLNDVSDAASVIRPVDWAYMRGDFDARWAGCRPDGITDNTTPIANAVAQAILEGYKGLKFPGGADTYRVTAANALSGLNDFTISGDGTFEQATANLSILSFSDCHKLTVAGLGFTGLVAAGAVGGRHAVGFTDAVDVNTDIKLSDLAADVLGTSAFVLDSVEGATLAGLIARQVAEHGLYISNGCIDVDVTGVIVGETGYQAGTTGFTAASTCAFKTRAERVHLKGFAFRDLAGLGVLFESDAGNSVYSKQCSASSGSINSPSNTTADALRLAVGVEDCSIDRVTVKGHGVGVRDQDSIRCSVSRSSFDVASTGHNATGASGPTDFLGSENTYIACSSHAIVQTNAGTGNRHRNPTLLAGVLGGISVPAGVAVELKPGLLTPAYVASYTPPSFEHDTISITLTGNINIAAISTSILGRKIRLVLTQDATGGRTTSWSSVYKRPAGFTLTTTANTRSVIEFTCIATNVWLLTGFQTGIAV